MNKQRPPAARRKAWCSHLGADDGFTLVESVVAVVITVILFLLFATALSLSFRQSRDTRSQEQATLLGIEGLELARGLAWEEMAMTATAAGDTRVGGGQLLAAAVGLPANEDLVLDATSGAIAPTRAESLDEQAFTIFQYVTEVEPGLRRVVIVVSWEDGDRARENHLSSLVAEARYG
jgi:prepilin-type N-terminal cleavage/methylation domain-containing protein